MTCVLLSLFPNIAITLRICLCLNVLKQQWWNVIFETETDKEWTQVINVTATFESFVDLQNIFILPKYEEDFIRTNKQKDDFS